jgi:hypothetical protein
MDKFRSNGLRVRAGLTFTILVAFAGWLTGQSFFDLLYSETSHYPRSLSLTVATDSLYAVKVIPQKAVAQKTTMGFTDVEGNSHQWDVKLEVRGKFRRQYCDLAPLRLNLNKSTLADKKLNTFDKYRLVVPCFKTPTSHEEVMKEYLAYRAYNIISSASLRVQLLSITFRDPLGHKPDRTVPAFIVETYGELVARLHHVAAVKTIGISPTNYISSGEATNALFQYLIGNTDWDASLAHNTIFLEQDNGKFIPFGYDFDFSGWVNAAYAKPRNSIGQYSVTQRVYLGYTQPDSVLLPVIKVFSSQKERLYHLIETAPITKQEKRRLSKYTDEFFTQMDALVKADRKLTSVYERLRGKEAHLISTGMNPDNFKMPRH